MLKIEVNGFAYYFEDEGPILDYLDHHAVDVQELPASAYRPSTAEPGNSQAQLDLARGERDMVTKRMIGLEQELCDLRSKYASAVSERDNATRIITKIAAGGREWMCPYCEHCMGTVVGIADCDIAGQCQRPFTQFRLKQAKT